MWVDSTYHDQIKIDASLKGMSIIEYTKYLSNKQPKKNEEKKKSGFNFDF